MGTMGKKIVIAEDEEHIGRMVKFKLEKEGFTVIWARDGVSALEKVKSEMPSLVLLDVMMPGKDGIEVLKTIKADQSLMNIPVVMLTAKGQESDVISGLDAGAADYIIKPFRPTELVVRLKRLMSD